MPTYKDDEARRKSYVKRWGEEEGQRRFDAYLQDQSDPPMDQYQHGGSGAPVPRTRERTPKRPTKKPNKNDVYVGVATGLSGLDWLTANYLYPPWKDERLTHEEIGRLAEALGDEILDSERLTKWFVRASKTGKHGKLAFALAAIAIPRMQRRGMMPGIFPDESGESADPMAGGPAHVYHGPDGQWQEQAAGGDLDPSQMVGGVPQQGGRDDLSELSDQAIRFRDGRRAGVPVGVAAEV